MPQSIRLIFTVFFFLTILYIASFAQAQDVIYSTLDRATVLVMAFDTIDTLDAKGKWGINYVLASPRFAFGSGVAVDRQGLILTARHIVEHAVRVVVRIPGKSHALPARVIAENKESDLALLAVPGPLTDVFAIPDSQPPIRVRQTVHAVGYPVDINQKVPQSSTGSIAGVDENGLLKLSISVNPGNSGGILVDSEENFLGIVIGRADVNQGIQGIGYATSLNKVRSFYQNATDRNPRFENSNEGFNQTEIEAAIGLAKLIQHKSVRGIFDLSSILLKKDEEVSSEGVLEPEENNPFDRDSALSALVAAYYWNLAAWSFERRNQDHRATLDNAYRYSDQAVELDPSTGQNFPLIAYSVARNTPWHRSDLLGTTSPIRARVSEELKELQSDTGSPVIPINRNVVSPQQQDQETDNYLIAEVMLGIRYPLQLFSFGLGIESFLFDAINLYGRFDIGLGLRQQGGFTAHVFEAYAGFPFIHYTGWTTAKDILSKERSYAEVEIKYRKRRVQSHHVLVLEAGTFGYSQGFRICPENQDCESDSTSDSLTDTEDVIETVFYLSAGLRYLYLYGGPGARVTTTHNQTVISLQALFLPMGVPDSDNLYADARFSKDVKEINPADIGVKGDITFTEWMLDTFVFNVGLGYLPVTRNFYGVFTFGMQIWIL